MISSLNLLSAFISSSLMVGAWTVTAARERDMRAETADYWDLASSVGAGLGFFIFTLLRFHLPVTVKSDL